MTALEWWMITGAALAMGTMVNSRLLVSPLMQETNVAALAVLSVTWLTFGALGAAAWTIRKLREYNR